MTRPLSLPTRLGAILLAGTALAPPLHAQDAAPPDSAVVDDADAAAGARVYTLADLAQYAPQTALDMVRRIPGFSLEGGSRGRGLGQANQNVLINGARISGKSNDAVSVLSRIDADQVIRIEIVDGASLDVPGLTGEVANVVYEPGGVSGTWRWNAQLRERIADDFLDGSVSLSGGGTNDRWSMSVGTNRGRQGNFGPEIVRAPDGTLLVTREEISRFNGDSPRIAGSYSRSFDSGTEMSLNGAAGLGFQRNSTEGVVTLADGTTFTERSTGQEDEWSVEVGGDVAFDLGGGRLKLIGLQRAEHSPTIDTFGRVGGALARFDRTIDESESIVRGEYGWSAGPADWEVSLEGARNTLTATSLLVQTPVDEPPLTTAFPDSEIGEWRGEAIASLSRPLANNLSLQVNGGAEISQIAADGGEPRRYVNPKGLASLNWRASERLTLDASIERRVDQLNFFDFLATVDVRDDTDRGRNNAISPPTRWIARAEAVVRLGEWGSVTPSLSWQRIEGVIEAIPIDADTEALGNAGNATRWGAGVEGTLLLAPLGVNGARIDFNLDVGDSRFIDPLLGVPRALNGQTYSRINVSFRHDIAGSPFAYGGSVFTQDEEGRFRLDQFANRFNGGPRVNAFVEHKNLGGGVQARVEASNLLQSSDRFERIAYVDRRDGPVAFTESQVRDFGRVVRLQISGSF